MGFFTSGLSEMTMVEGEKERLSNESPRKHLGQKATGYEPKSGIEGVL
jgi:hypothetical protein